MDVSHLSRLEPEQVVQASMLALDRGEIVCIPALEDVDMLIRQDRAAIDLLIAGMRPELAERYSHWASRFGRGWAHAGSMARGLVGRLGPHRQTRRPVADVPDLLDDRGWLDQSIECSSPTR